MLVTERGGRLRRIRSGALDPQPLAGIPKVQAVRNAGLFDVALHPNSAENKLVYLPRLVSGAPHERPLRTMHRGRVDAEV
jgi:glucose/arabinose dehydrogenase